MGQVFGGIRSDLKDAVCAGDWERVQQLARNNGLREEELEFLAEVFHNNRRTFPSRQFLRILKNSSSSSVGSVFPKTVEKKLWRSVGGCLQYGLGEEQRRWAVQRAKTEHACDADLSVILPYCTVDQFDSTLDFALSREIWGAVGKLLRLQQKGWVWSSNLASRDQRKKAFDEAIQKAGDRDLADVLLACADYPELRDICLRSAVVRGLWMVVGRILELKLEASKNKKKLSRILLMGCARPDFSNGLSSLDRWVLQEVGKRADEDAFIEHFLPHVKGDLVQLVLAELVKRRMWQAATTLLLQSQDDDADQQPQEQAAGRDVTTPPPQPRGSSSSQSYDDQFDFILKESVRRGMWRVVKELNQHGFSDQQLAWVNEQATESAGMFGFPLDTSRHGPRDQLQSLLALLDTSC